MEYRRDQCLSVSYSQFVSMYGSNIIFPNLRLIENHVESWNVRRMQRCFKGMWRGSGSGQKFTRWNTVRKNVSLSNFPEIKTTPKLFWYLVHEALKAKMRATKITNVMLAIILRGFELKEKMSSCNYMQPCWDQPGLLCTVLVSWPKHRCTWHVKKVH